MQKMILPGEWGNDSIPPPPKSKVRRRKKRNRLAVIPAVALLTLMLTAGSTFAFFKLKNTSLTSNAIYQSGASNQSKAKNYQSQSMGGDMRAVSTINGLNRISVIGSTAFIVDGHGRTISADPNPYGIAIAPTGAPVSHTPGSLRPGDIVVTNFGANQTGTTLVRFPAGKGPGLLFIWELPGSILSGSGSSLHCVGSSCAYTPNVLAPLGGLYTLLLGLLTAAIWSQYLEGGFASAFDFRAIFRRAGLQPGMTIIVWLMAIVAGIIGGLGVIVVGIGLLFTLPYAFAVIANLYGQFSQRTERAATAV
jgi:hypothetical protein